MIGPRRCQITIERSRAGGALWKITSRSGRANYSWAQYHYSHYEQDSRDCPSNYKSWLFHCGFKSSSLWEKTPMKNFLKKAVLRRKAIEREVANTIKFVQDWSAVKKALLLRIGIEQLENDAHLEKRVLRVLKLFSTFSWKGTLANKKELCCWRQPPLRMQTTKKITPEFQINFRSSS